MGLPQTTKRSEKDFDLRATDGDDRPPHAKIFSEGLEKL
jgi:hypothetical protein